MIDRNHPAVEAGAEGMEYPHLPTAHDAINAALPHLTADDLRHTPAGRALLAEGWDRGVADNERGWVHVYDGHDVDPDDPLAKCQTCGTPNPYREEIPND